MWNAVDELLEKSREEGLFPGCALAAGREGQVLYTNACGYLVRDGQQKVSHATRYDVGALTQVLGAMPLCMVAVEKGLFSLDDPITRFLPGVGEDKKSVTILHLLTQTSGLSPHFLLSEESKSDRDALKALLKHPLGDGVGEKVRDSGMGFLLLGFVLESVFAMPLDEAVKRFVTIPLGMSHTGFLPSGQEVAPTSIQDENGELQAGYPLDGNARFLHGVAGHSGLFTSLKDITLFASMLAQNGRSGQGVFLSQRSVHLATTERTRGLNAARGYGFHITKRSDPFLGHLWPSDGYGLIDPAGGSLIALSPTDRFFAVLVMNGDGSFARNKAGARFHKMLLNAVYAAFQHEG